MLPAASIVDALRGAASAQREILEAIKHTRTAIVALGGELAALIAALPPEDVSAIALGVIVILRGTPTVDDIDGLTIEYLPALDDDSYETRPGATSLYLEALGKGQSRVFLEVRSSPGQIVLATSSIRELDDTLDGVRGIVIDSDSRVRLVVERRVVDDDAKSAMRDLQAGFVQSGVATANGRDGIDPETDSSRPFAQNAIEMATGPDAAALLRSFLDSLRTELQRRSRFNRAVDL